MSGGSLEYAYRHVEIAADELERQAETHMQWQFAQHLKLVAKAMHDVEWVLSCDYGEGDEVEAIQAAMGIARPVAPAPLEIADTTIKKLGDAIHDALFNNIGHALSHYRAMENSDDA